jgi:hypothetical protein
MMLEKPFVGQRMFRRLDGGCRALKQAEHNAALRELFLFFIGRPKAASPSVSRLRNEIAYSVRELRKRKPAL